LKNSYSILIGVLRCEEKLVSYIINKLNLFEGAAKQEFEKMMKDLMSYRNAWAHGRLSNENGKVWLNYFEGRPMKKELSDDI